MPKRKQKLYSRPRKPFDKIRIEEENILKERYGLKNKKEIWKADSSIGKMRNLAKGLITSSEEEKTLFIERLQKKGFGVTSIADVLALNKEDWLKRRLQTIVHQKKFANTPRQSRQFIAHRHVLVNGNIVNIPSYQVGLEEESQITSDIKVIVPKKKKVPESSEEGSEEVAKESEEVKEEGNDEEVVEEVKEEVVEKVAEEIQEVNEKPIEVETK
jgi:small subunit ribosomal protein S4